MVSADETRPRKGPGQINGKLDPPGKRKEKRARKAAQKSESRPEAQTESEAQTELKADAESDALLSATESLTEIVPDTIEPMEQQAPLTERSTVTPDTSSDIIAEPAAPAPVSAHSITDAYGDFARKSIEQTSSFFAQLAGVRSPNRAFELQSEFARTAFETFVDESRKIRELHRELAKQKLKGLEGLVMGRRAAR